MTVGWTRDTALAVVGLLERVWAGGAKLTVAPAEQGRPSAGFVATLEHPDGKVVAVVSATPQTALLELDRQWHEAELLAFGEAGAGGSLGEVYEPGDPRLRV